MTQVPTPGPLSVGDRVFAVADLRQTPNGSVWIKKGEEAVIVGELGVNNCLAIVLASNGNEGTWAKTCFRLAPTAPVEASGSELADALERVDRWANYEYTYEDTVAVGSPLSTFTAGDLRLILAALRPQPSGETREAVDLWYPIKGAIARAMQDERDGKPCGCIIEAGCEARGYHDPDYAASGFLNAATDAVNQLLSARPLALGGQQGVPQKWVEVARYATERGLTVHESNMRMEEFRRVVTPTAVLSVAADEEVK